MTLDSPAALIERSLATCWAASLTTDPIVYSTNCCIKPLSWRIATPATYSIALFRLSALDLDLGATLEGGGGGRGGDGVGCGGESEAGGKGDEVDVLSEF